MDAPSAPPPDPEDEKMKQEMRAEKERMDKLTEKNRIKSLRGRGGAFSLFSSVDMGQGQASRSTLG